MDQGITRHAEQGASSGLNSDGDLYHRGDERPYAGAWHSICRQPVSHMPCSFLFTDSIPNPTGRGGRNPPLLLPEPPPGGMMGDPPPFAPIVSRPALVASSGGAANHAPQSCCQLSPISCYHQQRRFRCRAKRLSLATPTMVAGLTRRRGALESAWVNWEVGHDRIPTLFCRVPQAHKEGTTRSESSLQQTGLASSDQRVFVPRHPGRLRARRKHHVQRQQQRQRQLHRRMGRHGPAFFS
ncbi:hypothetical protein LX32DRAFT_244728 [Colletotrichum zoysiae]|uniref:Uncharacterized protein n=1 Tax=Colletotrichum zoysiae TaxID=1216348 RepID=A0AAD9HPR2_9PEZI|nr:hypothetical protein LX32DRAFT_244728 [Colletotrichum zoysiae]